MVKVGFIGTGLMGQPMAQRLLDAQVSLVAYNRTPSKLEPLGVSGAQIADSPSDAIALSDCVILMLTNTTAIQEVLLSEPKNCIANSWTTLKANQNRILMLRNSTTNSNVARLTAPMKT